MPSTSFLRLASLVSFVASSSAAVVDFSSATDLAAFSQNGPGLLNYSETAGAGGSGAVTSFSIWTDMVAAIYTQGYANTIGDTLMVSMDYKMAFQSGGPDLRLGFTTTSTGVFDREGGDVWVDVYGNTPGKSYAYSADSSSHHFASPTMIEGNWYRLSLNLQRTGTESYSLFTSLHDLGTAGTSSPTWVATNSASFSSSALGAAANLHAGFFLYMDTPAADNFAVPEPSSLALTSLAVGLCALRRRRK